MRHLYADMSPGYGWNGREPEALEAATATQATSRTVSSFLTAGTAALTAIPRPLAFLVGGTTPAHAPATATITGTVDGVADSEVVYLPTTSTGARKAGAVSGRKAWDAAGLQVVYSAGSGTGGTVAIGLGLPPMVEDLRVIAIESWLEAFPDRRNPGMVDPFQLDAIVRTGNNKLDGGVATPNGNYDVPFALDALGDVARIARDFCLAEAGELKPLVFYIDHVTKRKNAQADLDKLRKAMASTGLKPPDPAKNVGGAVGSIGAEAKFVPPPSFTGSLGDFA